jgi:hypothetical protein
MTSILKKIFNFLFSLFEEFVFIPAFILVLFIIAICASPFCWIYDFFQYRWIMASGTEEQVKRAQKIYFEHKRTKNQF